ncbi:MAG: nitroreductase family protein [Bacilli bacterium]
MNDTCKLIREHCSIRSYNATKIKSNEIDEIIDCALRGATAGNMMMYSIIKITNKSNLEYLSKKCDNQNFIKSSGFALVFLCDSHKFYQYFRYRNIDGISPSIVDCMLGIQDVMIAAQNSVIAAESMGIGTCYIGDIMENYEDIKKHLNLPKYVFPVSMVVYGRYDSLLNKRDRFLKEHIVFDEKYPNISEDFINEMFKGKELIRKDYANHIYNFKINSKFYQEMIRSINLYLNDWK